MGLSFQVGVPEAVWLPDMASEVRRLLESRYGLGLSPPSDGYHDPDIDPDDRVEAAEHTSEEMGWSWVGALQERAKEALGAGGAPHLLACDSWSTVYLPLETKCETVTVSEQQVTVASLPALAREMTSLLSLLGLPREPEALLARRSEYLDDDDRADDDPDLQAAIELSLAIDEAVARRLPLWVVK
jgi:hypothetical protein